MDENNSWIDDVIKEHQKRKIIYIYKFHKARTEQSNKK